MSLFKKNKRFETNVKQQLNELEVKPTDSLWQRIDANLSNDDFETGMQNRLQAFEQTPYAETWNRIENELPSPKPKNPFLKFYGGAAILLLLATGAWIGILWNQHNPLRTESPQIAIQSKPIEQTDSKTGENLPIEPIKIVTQKQRKQEIESLRIDENKQSNSQVTRALQIESKQVSSDNNNTKPKASQPSQPVINSTAVSNPKTEFVSHTITPIIEGKKVEPKTNEAINQTTIAINDESLPTVAKELAVPKDSNTAKTTLVVPKEINQNDSLALQADALSNLDKTKSGDDLSRFSLSIYGGAMMSYATYKAPTTNLTSLNFEENIAFRKQVEKPTLDWTGGFILDYHLNDRWMISSGLMMLNFRQEFQYNTSQAATPANPNEIGAPVFNPNDTFSVGKTLSSRIKYSWTEIPILVNYNVMRGKRFNLHVQAGVSYGFLGTVDGNMVSYNNKGVLILSDKQSFPQIRNMFFATVMPQVSYSFGQNVSLGCVPTFKYGLNSMIGNERWIQQHPYFIGLNLCLRKRF